MRILSYNIFYKTMITIDDRPLHPKCWPITDGTTACLKNVAEFIEKQGPYDFVGLQEASNWQAIQDLTPTLKEMTAVSHKPDLEEIVTFYDGAKYKLDHIIRGQMEDANRPFIILFFDNNLCVINLHAGHNHDIKRFDEHLKTTLLDNFHAKIIAKYLTKLQTSDIIMMGDFNANIPANYTILTDPFFYHPRKMYGVNHEPTCCSYQLTKVKGRYYDQILSTLHDNHTKVYPVTNASDHMPIIADIVKHVGYDFDGVLHLDVDKPDEYGQRHAINDEGPYQPFSEIIDRIQKNIENKEEIAIITSRSSNTISKKAVQTHLEQNSLPNIPVHFTSGRKKVHLLHKLKINEYYDDSCLQINEVYTAQLEGQLPHLNHLYFVIPEKRKIILANDIGKLCAKQNGGFNNYRHPEIRSLLQELDAAIDNHRPLAEIDRLESLILLLLKN